ncbi:MAG: Ig-like domain-containing protein, partial [Chloroflexi bacterium]|nr:Ig-like domain-containing protein [Chloroflexota bacterium]
MANLTGNAAFTVTVSTAARNTGDTVMTSGFVSAFSTGATADATAPQVIPPTTPASNQTGVGTNARVILTFSEGMDNAATQSALSVKPCTDNVQACATPGGALIGSVIWGGAGSNIVTFEPSVALAANRWHKVTVAATARDLGGNAMASAYSFVFKTGAGAAAAPSAPAVTTPQARDWTAGTQYSISGAAAADTLVQVWTDGGTAGTIDGSDTVVASLQLAGGLTTWTLAVPLTLSADNLFQVTAANSAGARSTSAAVPIITQGELRTVVGTLTLNPGSDSITVSAAFTGDTNSNNSAVVEYRTPPGVGSYTIAGSMTRGSERFTLLVMGMASSGDYDVRVTFTDADGAVGANPVSGTVTTLSGNQNGVIGTQVASNFTLASRAGQSTVFSVTLGATA